MSGVSKAAALVAGMLVLGFGVAYSGFVWALDTDSLEGVWDGEL